MTDTATNRAIVKRLFTAMCTGDLAVIDELVADDLVQHNPRLPSGRGAFRSFIDAVAPAEATIHRILADGDLVAIHHHLIPFASAVVDIFRVIDGRVVEHWDVIQPIPETTASGLDLFSQQS